MRDVTAVNEKYFKQAVEQMNESELFPVKIQLGSELKESTLKVFMENVEAVPVEKETEIGPKIVEMYNFIFDEAYQIPEGIFDEEVVMEEVKMEDAVDPSVEVAAPVGGTVEAVVKVKKVKAPKEPKVKAERKPRPPIVPGELSRKQQVYAKWLENKEMTAKEMFEICSGLSIKTMVSWRYSWKKGSNLPKEATV